MKTATDTTGFKSYLNGLMAVLDCDSVPLFTYDSYRFLAESVFNRTQSDVSASYRQGIAANADVM